MGCKESKVERYAVENNIDDDDEEEEEEEEQLHMQCTKKSDQLAVEIIQLFEVKEKKKHCLDYLEWSALLMSLGLPLNTEQNFVEAVKQHGSSKEKGVTKQHMSSLLGINQKIRRQVEKILFVKKDDPKDISPRCPCSENSSLTFKRVNTGRACWTCALCEAPSCSDYWRCAKCPSKVCTLCQPRPKTAKKKEATKKKATDCRYKVKNNFVFGDPF